MKKKKLIMTLIIVVIALLGIMFMTTGRARTDVYLDGFNLSEDGKTMTLNIGVTGSSGYIRKMKRTSGSSNYYYTFYSTYGINSKMGAKDSFDIELDTDANEIYFYTGNKGYKLVLVKNSATQDWEKVNQPDNGPLKLDLPKIDDVLKVGINTYALNDNYFEYSDKETIETIYNIFDNLETMVPSITYNPESLEEMYAIIFYHKEADKVMMSDKVRMDTYVNIYRKDGKYYVEQRYNGIYEVTEKDFNIVKGYID